MYGYNPCDFDPVLSERRANQAQHAADLAYEANYERARRYLILHGAEAPSDDEIDAAIDDAADAEADAEAWNDEMRLHL